MFRKEHFPLALLRRDAGATVKETAEPGGSAYWEMGYGLISVYGVVEDLQRGNFSFSPFAVSKREGIHHRGHRESQRNSHPLGVRLRAGSIPKEPGSGSGNRGWSGGPGRARFASGTGNASVPTRAKSELESCADATADGVGAPVVEAVGIAGVVVELQVTRLVGGFRVPLAEVVSDAAADEVSVVEIGGG